MKSSKQTLTESSVILIVSTAFVKIIGALFKIPLASDLFLGEVGFGYYSVAHDLYAPFYTLAISGLPVAVSHIIAENISQSLTKDAYNSFVCCKKLFVILGVIFSALLAIFAAPALIISKSGLNSAYSVFTIIPSVFLCFLMSVYRGYFEGFSNMYPSAVSKVIESVCKLLLGLFFSFVVLKLTDNVALAAGSAMLAITAGTFLSTLYLIYKFKRKNPIDIIALQTKDSFKAKDLKLFLTLSLPFAIASLSSSLVSFFDIFTVKMPIDAASDNYLRLSGIQLDKISGDISAYLYGIRSKAFTVYNIIPTFTASLGISALPILTSLMVKNNIKTLSNNVLYTIKLICTVTLPASIGLFALSNRIMPLLYSSATDIEVGLLKLYAVTALFSGVAIPLTTVLQALGKQRYTIINILIGLLLKIVFSLCLVYIPQINIYAAPIGTLVCYIYIAVSMMWGICGTLSCKRCFSVIIKCLFSSMLCGACAYFVTIISDNIAVTVLSIIVGMLVYFGLILITKVFTNSEIKAFPIINKLVFKEKH